MNWVTVFGSALSSFSLSLSLSFARHRYLSRYLFLSLSRAISLSLSLPLSLILSPSLPPSQGITQRSLKGSTKKTLFHTHIRENHASELFILIPNWIAILMVTFSLNASILTPRQQLWTSILILCI